MLIWKMDLCICVCLCFCEHIKILLNFSVSFIVSANSKMDVRRKYNISFDVLDLKSFKRSAPNHGWAYIIFILKDGTTFPALHFHNGGSKALLKELEKFVHIRRY